VEQEEENHGGKRDEMVTKRAGETREAKGEMGKRWGE
jgi:hypothetical protein